MQQNKTMSIRNMVLMGMLAAIAVVLMLLEFPLPFIAPSFYELDFSEVPVLIGAFAMGPLAGVIIELLKILLNLMFNGTATAYVGEIANFLVGCALVVPAALVYKYRKTRKGALTGMITGTLVMVVTGCLMNGLILLPWYAANFFASSGGMDAILKAGAAVHPFIGSVTGFVLVCVAPFNLLKGVMVSVVTFLLYKKVSVVLKAHSPAAVPAGSQRS